MRVCPPEAARGSSLRHARFEGLTCSPPTWPEHLQADWRSWEAVGNEERVWVRRKLACARPCCCCSYKGKGEGACRGPGSPPLPALHRRRRCRHAAAASSTTGDAAASLYRVTASHTLNGCAAGLLPEGSRLQRQQLVEGGEAHAPAGTHQRTLPRWGLNTAPADQTSTITGQQLYHCLFYQSAI